MVPASQLNKPNGTRGGGVPLGIPGGRGGGQMGNRGRGGGIAGMGRGGGRAGGTHGHSGSAPMAGIGRGGMMGGRGGMHGNPRTLFLAHLTPATERLYQQVPAKEEVSARTSLAIVSL